MKNSIKSRVTLETQRLSLVPLSLSHASQRYVNWLNDKEVNKYLETKNGYTIEKLNEYLKSIEKNNICAWGIHLKQTGMHIGNVKIDPISFRNRNAEYGVLIGEKSSWGKGYAHEASEKVFDFCFTYLNLRKITLGVVSANRSAVKLYERMGFEKEGLLKSHCFHDGQWQDVIRMALFSDKNK